MNKSLEKFNRTMKDSDRFYRRAAKYFGISDCVMWILYTMRESDKPLTQKDIVDTVYIPPQTINSALKKLESDGYASLSNDIDRRSKHVYLTAKGESLAQNTVDRLISAETAAMTELTADEQELFISLFSRYVSALNNNSSVFSEVSDNEQL